MGKRIAVTLLLVIGIIRPCSTFSWPPPFWRKNPQSSTSLFRFLQDDRIGYIDARGRVIIPAQFDNDWSQDDFSDGLVRVESNGHVSYVDDKGQIRLSVDFDMQLGSFSEGLVQYYVREPAPDANETNGCCRHLHGYIDQAGRPVIRAKYGEAEPFSEGLASVREEAANFHLGRAGYIDRTGRWAIPPQFAMGGPFRDGRAIVVQDGKCQYGPGRPLAAPGVPTRTSCGDNPNIKERCMYGVINKSGTFIVQPNYEFIRDYSEGLAAFKTNDKWGFFDATGQLVIAPRFDEALECSDGAAAVRVDKNWGYVSRTGEWLAEPRYRQADVFSDDRAPVLTKSGWGYIDKSGVMVIPAKFWEATPFAKGLAHVRIGRDEYAWIGTNGEIVFTYSDKRRRI